MFLSASEGSGPDRLEGLRGTQGGSEGLRKPKHSSRNLNEPKKDLGGAGKDLKKALVEKYSRAGVSMTITGPGPYSMLSPTPIFPFLPFPFLPFSSFSFPFLTLTLPLPFLPLFPTPPVDDCPSPTPHDTPS